MLVKEKSMKDKDSKRNQGLAAIVLLLASIGCNVILFIEWSREPWVFYTNSYGLYVLGGAMITMVIGLAVLGTIETGEPGYVWNIVLGLMYMVAGAGLLITVVAYLPIIHGFMSGAFLGWVWIPVAIAYIGLGLISMPSRKIVRI